MLSNHAITKQVYEIAENNQLIDLWRTLNEVFKKAVTHVRIQVSIPNTRIQTRMITSPLYITENGNCY